MALLLPALSLTSLAQVAREQEAVGAALAENNLRVAVLALTSHLRQQGLFEVKLYDCLKVVRAQWYTQA